MTTTLKKINDEVFIADDAIVRLDAEQMSFLKQQAQSSSRKRARICAHRSNDDALHEMLIAISADSYIRPHKHASKIESFHIIEGLVDVVVFDDAGAIVDVIELGDISSGKNFYYRLSDSLFHTLLIRSDFLTMHEVTNGPFVANETLFAPFAPPESCADEARVYIMDLDRAIAARRLYNKEEHTK
jgi:cupin fold WbuC family metalloprotein